MIKPVDLSNTILLRDEVLANIRPVRGSTIVRQDVHTIYPAQMLALQERMAYYGSSAHSTVFRTRTRAPDKCTFHARKLLS